MALWVRARWAAANALELAEWDLPFVFGTLRRLMEARMPKAGRREYVQGLRVLETFDIEDLHAAVKAALQLGAVGFDAVKHLLLCRVEKRPPKARSRRLSLSAPRYGLDPLGGELHVSSVGECLMRGAPELLLVHHLKMLKMLKLPTFLRESDKMARPAVNAAKTMICARCAAEGQDHVRFLARLVKLKLIDRERRMIERRIKAASAMGLGPMVATW